MDLTRATDELLAAPWEAFVETRTRLAAELVRAGKRDDSRALKKIRRPTAAAWATNQVVRRSRAAVDAYLRAGDELRDRQAAMLAGEGDRSAYQAAAESFRQAAASLSQAVRQLLSEGGREPERAQIEGVVANVRVAALADDRRAELLAGRLLADLSEGDGLQGLFGASLAAGAAATPPVARPRPAPLKPAAARPDDGVAPSAHETAAEAKREARARTRREEHARRLAAATDEEASAREDAAVAATAAEQARQAHAAAHDRVRELEETLTAARGALEEATSALRTAERGEKESEGAAQRAARRRQSLENDPPG